MTTPDKLQGLRVAVVADGSPANQHTNSGVARGMYEALTAHPRVSTVLPVNVGFAGWPKAMIALQTFRFSGESRWRVRYSHGPMAVRVRSAMVEKQIEQHGGSFDLVLLIRGLYRPLSFPYALFIDSTVALTGAGWPPLNPRGREQARSIDTDRTQLHAAAHVFTASRHVAEHVVRDFGVAAERVTPVGGGLNYPLAALPPRAPSPEPTILFVGHDFRRKGGDVLVEAFQHVRRAVPGARLHLVGRGTTALGSYPGITVMGAVDDRQVLSELYRTATVFCLPARFEPYGLVLLEALAHGVPCVATRVDAIPEILHDGRLGLLVKAEDANGLADALISLLRNQQLQETLSMRGRAEVRDRGTWEAVADRLVTRWEARPAGPSVTGVQCPDGATRPRPRAG